MGKRFFCGFEFSTSQLLNEGRGRTTDVECFFDQTHVVRTGIDIVFGWKLKVNFSES